MAVDLQALAAFTTAYWRAIELELDRIGREQFPFHHEPCRFACAYQASDGIAVFYLPGEPSNGPPGLYAYDHSQHTLNEILQSLHINRLQFKVPIVGTKWEPMQGPLEFTERIPEIQTTYMSQMLREGLIRGQQSAPGLTVAPIIYLDGGVVSHVYPGRVKLWSPIVEFVSTGKFKYFSWNHADIWWQPAVLSLPNPELTAQSDLIAMREVQSIFGAIAIEQFGRDTNQNAAAIFENEILQFQALLAQEPNESTIHNWLVNHRPFLDVTARRILSKVSFGKHVSDFVIERADGTYELVEIEGVQRIFTPSGSEPRAQFNHACTQVRDWMRYINENLRTVEGEQGLSGIYQPDGRVVMGRSDDIDTEQAKQRWKHLKSEALLVDTYDDLVARVRQLVAVLRRRLV